MDIGPKAGYPMTDNGTMLVRSYSFDLIRFDSASKANTC